MEAVAPVEFILGRLDVVLGRETMLCMVSGVPETTC